MLIRNLGQIRILVANWLKRVFFEKNVPAGLLVNGEPIERAKNIYSFIQNHYTWNKRYGLWKKNKVKTAFDEKKGNAAEINISLINLLNSAGIKANMMLLATRDRGLPKMNHPVMSDFNYIVAKVDIDGTSYLLDASSKTMPFGMLPFHCLNYIGRVMDFKNDSYWFNILPEKRNKKNIRIQLEVNEENKSISGVMNQINSGYFSMLQREEINQSSQEDYLERLENEFIEDGRIGSYKLLTANSTNKKVVERIEFETNQNIIDQYLYINPFVLTFFSENPFLAEDRNYPIDFGYTRSYAITMNLKVPKGYQIKSLPETIKYVLPENDGGLRLETKKNYGDSVSLLFDLTLGISQYPSTQYDNIKTLFAKAIQAQTQTLIVLQKI